MTPPKEQGQGTSAETPTGSSAVSFCVETMKTRPEYLRAASARRQGTAGFLLQARDRSDGQARVQVGFTASKKIGNAVMRNRAKRRLRALARELLPQSAQAGWDYVLVARPDATVSRDFADLRNDLAFALHQVHRGGRG